MTDHPPHWLVRPLGDVVDVLDYRRVPVSASERSSRHGSVPYYGATGLVDWIDRPLFDEDLVLLGEDGVQFFDESKPKAYTVSGPCWVNNHAHVLRPRRALVEDEFLTHFLNQCDYRGFVNGTTRLKLTQSAMLRMPVPLPDLAEQRSIVDHLEGHLSRLDAARVSLSAMKRRLLSLRRSWLQSQLACSPAERSTVGAELVEGRGGWSRSRSHTVDSADGVPYLKMNNIASNGGLVLDSFIRVSGDPEDVARYAIRAGDVLFNSKNSGDLVGKTAVADPRIEGWTFNENIMRLRFSSRVVPAFAGLWFHGQEFRDHVRVATRASTNVAAVYMSALRHFPMLVPSQQRQWELVQGFDRLLEKETQLLAAGDASARRSQALRRSLLRAAFSGRLSPSHGRSHV